VVAKARRVKLGNPNGVESQRRAGIWGAALRAAVSENMAAFAADLAPLLANRRAAGRVSLRAIASEFIAPGIRTRRGGKWQASNVKQLLERTRWQSR
jgi:Recombinase